MSTCNDMCSGGYYLNVRGKTQDRDSEGTWDIIIVVKNTICSYNKLDGGTPSVRIMLQDEVWS